MKWRINAITALYIKTYKQYYGVEPSTVFIAMAMAMPADKMRKQIAYYKSVMSEWRSEAMQ